MNTTHRGIRRRTEFVPDDSLRQRFWSKVAIAGPEDCWIWQGARKRYGCIKHHGKVLAAHVVAFVLSGGVIPADELVTHTCDTKWCCNPAHLKAGTVGKNLVEAWERGRRTKQGG